MKHILPILTAALVCMGAYTASAQDATSEPAPFTFKVDTWDYKNEWNQGSDFEYYRIQVTGGTGKLYITDFLNNVYSANQNDSIMQQGITSYGYYNVKDKTPGTPLDPEKDVISKEVNATDRIVVGDPYQQSQWHEVVNRYGYELGTFQEGDEIAIWVEQGGQNVSVGSYTAYQSKNTSRYNTGWSVDALAQLRGENMPVAELTLYHSNGGSTQLRFGLYGVATEAIGGGEGGGNGGGTPGAPLPGGVQTALIAGLFALGFWYVRRRKAIAA